MAGPVQIDDSELQDLLADIQDAMQHLGSDLLDQMRKAAYVVEAEAKIKSSGRPGPEVDTGRHRASISSEAKLLGNSVQGIVGAGAFYSPYLEYGTSKMPPYPYLRPAVEAKMDEIERLLGEALDKVVRRIVEG
jgi:HK97 gp10 family phage protein